jgi:hypothetical protein
LAVFSALTSGSFGGFVLTLALNIVFIVFFMKGHPWARVVLAVFQLLGFFGDLYTITVKIDYSLIGLWILFLLIPLLAAAVLCCYFLAFDKGVSAYQYEKRTGGDRYL